MQIRISRLEGRLKSNPHPDHTWKPTPSEATTLRSVVYAKPAGREGVQLGTHAMLIPDTHPGVSPGCDRSIVPVLALSGSSLSKHPAFDLGLYFPADHDARLCLDD